MKTNSKNYSILQRYPEPILNNTTTNNLGNTADSIEIFPPEIFFKDIEPNQNYEVTVTIRNISKRVRRFKFTQPKTTKFSIEHDMQGPVAAGLAVKMNVSFETSHDGDFHDVVEIQAEGSDQKYQLFLHALKPAADIQFEPLVNFRFIPVKTTKHEEIEFKNEGRVTGMVHLSVDPIKGQGLMVEPTSFTIEPEEIRRVRVSLTSNEADLITRLINVKVEGQERPRAIEITGTSVEQHLSIVFEEGGGQKSSLNFGTLYMGERREYPAFLVNNGPMPASFNLRFMNGLRNLDEDHEETAGSFISPAQAGKELTDRVLTVEPLTGSVGPYSQVPLTFICRTKKYEKKGGFSDNARRILPPSSQDSREGSQDGQPTEEKFTVKPEDYASLAIIGIDNVKHDDLKVQMLARACYPEIKLSKQALQFGECASNERKDFLLTLTNKNEDLPVDFNFTQAASFKAVPTRGKLLPGADHTINISFEPKNLGHFNQEMVVEILKGVYRIPLKLAGYANKVGQKEKGIRGPMARPTDFQPAKNLISDEEAEHHKLSRRKVIVAYDKGALIQSYGVQKALQNGNQEHVERYFDIKDNKNQANTFLKNQRINRQKDENIKNHLRVTNRLPPETLEEIEKDPDLGMNTQYPDIDIGLPEAKDLLYVEKPIDRYEPSRSNLMRLRNRRENDQDRIVKKKWKAQPQTQVEVRDCSVELSGEQLQKINAGPQQINFKTVFVKSSTTKSFIIGNDLRQHIYVRLLVDQYPELQQSSPLSQVIPPGQEAGFDIIFCSQTSKTFTAPITYYINDRPFTFLVQAQADPVVLDVSKKLLKFEFADDNMDMSVTEQLTISNHGNAKARFKWQVPAGMTFIPEPLMDEIPAGSSKSVKITFKPQGQKSEEETLLLQIEDGIPVEIKCLGVVNESKCTFIEKILDFGNIPVGQKTKEMTLHIKNQMRNIAIFHIECPYEELSITPKKGRITADQKMMFTASFISNVEKNFQAEIVVNIRGGKTLRLPIRAVSKIPIVEVQENEIDFGGITQGDSKTLPLTLINHSDVPAKILLDIRDYPEFEIILPPQKQDDDVVSEIMVPIQDDPNYRDLENMNPEDIQDPYREEDMEEEDEEDDDTQNRYVQISLRPEKSPLLLQLKYKPAEEQDPRDFILPLKLFGVGEVPGLIRKIKGVGVKPRFILEPTQVDFKTKVIAKGSKPLPFHQDVTIRNPDVNSINWSVDRDVLEESKVFQMNPNEGRLEPGGFSTVRVTFNPLEPTDYQTSVPVYLDGNKSKAYLMVELKGEGADAKIYFDRREVILPPTPLEIQSKATFMVCHNGYENLELRFKIANEVGKLPIEINFPDGQNLGVTKQKVKVEAIFNSPKPLSFTTFIDFFDDEGNKFSIPISGTTDNSLFTVFSFMQRSQNEIRLEIEPNKPIKLIQDATDLDERGKPGQPSKAFSKAGGSSVISRTAESLFGFSPVSLQQLEKSCEFISRWYNSSIQTSSIQSFPTDVINQNGLHVYDLVQYLSGKRPPGQASKSVLTAASQNAKDYIQILLQQYEDLINYLKVNGAHLNTVRPEYLLSTQDYLKFLKLNPKEENFKPKTVERVMPYLAMDSWLTVFYQILKIYYLNRVTPKSLKSLPGMPANETNVETAMTKSNIYSVPETILLKWMTYHYCKMNPLHQKAITNFDADLHDGLVFASLIRSHFGNAHALQDLKVSVQYEDQVLFNAKKIIEAVGEIGLQTHVIPDDIQRPGSNELLLFCIQLYQGLPHYIPKATIEFPAVLGDLVTKNLELSNPSKNPISYWVKLDGCSDFSIESDQVRIEPGTQMNFPIKFQSRISQQVTAKIVFTNKKESNVQAAAMVFQLVSNVFERNSVDTINKSTKLYKACQIDLELHNPFPQDVNFKVQIVYEKNLNLKKGKKGLQDQPASSQNAKAAAAKEKANEQKSAAPEPFSCKQETMKVKKNATVNIPILFLPFELGMHKCHVVFTDEAVGELQYTIIGKAELPEILDTFQGDCNAEESFSFKKVLGFRNDKLEQAKNQIMDKAAQQKQKELQAQQLADAKAGKIIPIEQKLFEIEISNPFFSGTNSITLVDTSKTGGINNQKETHKSSAPTPRSKKGEKDNVKEQLQKEQSEHALGNQNLLELTCNPSKPASYTCYVILKSQDRTDIRLYEYKLTAIPQKIKAQLEFRVPARGVVAQEIPIVNNSNQEWKVVATLDQSKGGQFQLNRGQILVKKNAQDNFSLSFKPQWVCETTGLLTLKNESTKEEYEYELKGIGEEPLAEDHIILNCKARETTTHIFEIKNTTDKNLTYSVWTDLQNAVGKKEFSVKARQSFNYELSITPLLGGVYTASITFQDNEERFMWWTVEVRTDSPRPEAVIDLKAFIRQATSAEISLSNPLTEPITFEVFYSGDGLIGDSSFSLEPKNIGTYNLIYSPLAAGSSQGTIGFLNEKVGEFWYDLSLVAEENPVVHLDLLECELGKVASHTITLENPTGQELYLEYRNSNTTNFEIVPDKILLPGYESIKVKLQYSPTNLDVVEVGNVVFENSQVGKWEYYLEGKGMLPTVMEPSPISTAVGSSTSSMLTFKNPFKEAQNVSVHMETEDTKIFSLLLKRNKFNIGPLSVLQIPYSFSPQTMTESKATIIVSMSKQLVWKYPLRGIAESASESIDFHFKTRARKPYEELLKIVLPGFNELNNQDTFRFELNVQNPALKSLVERSVFFEQKNQRLFSPDDPLTFQMRFEPLRPFKTNTEFIIYKSSGGRWKFNVIFEALEPEVDDTIVIQSPLHKTSSVSFKLNNHLKSYAEFVAFFTPDSAPEFIVYPKNGQLEPYGKDGTNFIISFTPTEYGKAKVGRMVIQTEEMQWTYEIKGSHPQYKIPEVGGGRIENRLSKDIQKTIKQKQTAKKNFIRENLKTSQFVQKSPKKNTEGGTAYPSVANLSVRKGEISQVGRVRDASQEKSVSKF